MKSLIAFIAISLTVSSVFAKSPDEDSLRVTSYQDWEDSKQRLGKVNNERFSKGKLFIPNLNLDHIVKYVDAFEDKTELLNILQDKYDKDFIEQDKFDSMNEDEQVDYLEGLLESLKMPPSND